MVRFLADERHFWAAPWLRLTAQVQVRSRANPYGIYSEQAAGWTNVASNPCRGDRFLSSEMSIPTLGLKQQWSLGLSGRVKAAGA